MGEVGHGARAEDRNVLVRGDVERLGGVVVRNGQRREIEPVVDDGPWWWELHHSGAGLDNLPPQELGGSGHYCVLFVSQVSDHAETYRRT
jgi:hypothetical protein